MFHPDDRFVAAGVVLVAVAAAGLGWLLSLANRWSALAIGLAGLAVMVVAPQFLVGRSITFLFFSFAALGVTWLGYLWLRLDPRENAPKTATVAISTLAALIAVDLVLFSGVLDPEKYDLPGIPVVRRVDTAAGYYTFIPQPNFRREVETPGQVASHVKDDGFYQKRRLVVETDSIGLRNEPASFFREQDVVILGDSFVFGYGTTQDAIWSEVLADITGLEVYNTGVHGTDQTHQVELLYHLVDMGLKVGEDSTVFLAVYEGNDLGAYSVYNEAAVPRPGFLKRYADTTLLRSIRRLAQYQTGRGEITYLVYSSPRFGKVAFSDGHVRNVSTNYLGRASEHALTNGIEQAFGRLGDLAEKRGFSVVVVYVPTKYRVYWSYFPDHPAAAADGNDFKDQIRDYSAEEGFSFHDLEPEFSRWAALGCLLWWRDDDHWNELGHEFVARISSWYLPGQPKVLADEFDCSAYSGADS